MAVVPQPGARLEEAEGRVRPPGPVRLEIIGMGEEEEIVELEERVHEGLENEELGGDELEEVEDGDGVGGAEVNRGGQVEEDEVLLNLGDRRVRGIEAEQVEIGNRLNPIVPGPAEGPPLLDVDGWHEIDRLGAWDCAMNTFSSMEEVPFAYRVSWGKAMTRVLTSIFAATRQEDLDRGLKWLLILPAALLRQAKRGGQNGRGRAEVAGRFRAVSEDNWGFLITSLVADRAREEKRRKADGQRATRPAMSEEEIKRQKRKVALEHLAKGQISKAVSRLTSHGVADTRDPAVMAGLRSKYISRGRELPATVTMGQPVDNVAGLKEALLGLDTGTSPGTGGMRGEFLTCLAEVWTEAEMTRLEDFSMLYLTGALPAWFFKVWGSVTTVPLFKTRERQALRPVGVMTPLIRSLHSLVIRENREALTSFLSAPATLFICGWRS